MHGARRLLHTADWHLGRRFNHWDLLDDQAAFADWLVELVVAEQIDAIRDMSRPKHFPILPAGHDEHIKYSFEMGYGQTTREAEEPTK